MFSRLIKADTEKKAPDNISSWLYQVTRNSIVDYYRAKKQTVELPDDLMAQSKEPDVLMRLSRCMLPMIKALPPSYQEPLTLSEVEGRKYKEVALELGLSLAAVKSRILRGRKLLHKSMVNCCTLYRDDTGKVVDYSQNKGDVCNLTDE